MVYEIMPSRAKDGVQNGELRAEKLLVEKWVDWEDELGCSNSTSGEKMLR
jgi:hypothetical protein